MFVRFHRGLVGGRRRILNFVLAELESLDRARVESLHPEARVAIRRLVREDSGNVLAAELAWIIGRILALSEGSKYMVMAPVVRGRKGEYRQLFDELRRAVVELLTIFGAAAWRSRRTSSPDLPGIDRSSSRTSGVNSQASFTASSGIAISTPNFCAWLKERPIRAMPEMPVGKPR